ncbi:MAG TPA: glycosyltransferase [bacterium]|nr:glycosyltransferase [bacterium]
MRKPLILHCLDGLGIGGAERQLILLLRHRPVEMADHVVCHVGPRKELSEEIRAMGIPVVDLSGGRRYSLLALFRLVRLAHRLRPSLIHADHDYGKLYARFASRILHIPLLATMGLTASNPWRHPLLPARLSLTRRLLYLIERTGARVATDHTMAISQTVMRDLIRKGVPPARISVVYRGLNLAEFPRLAETERETLRHSLGVQGSAPLLINVARLIRRKGQEAVIRAMPAVRSRFPGAKLLLVGDGPARERYREIVAAERLEEAVVLLGTRRDIPRLLQAADVFVFPSLREGTGVALLEAMAARRPCVVSDVPVFREILGEEGAGVFVPIERPDLLAEALIDVLGDPARLTEMGRGAREIIEERFDIERNAQEFARLCQWLITARRFGAPAEAA